MRFALFRKLRASNFRPSRSPSLCRYISEMATTVVNKDAHPFSKPQFEALLNRRFFYAPAFEIYGGECDFI